MDFLLAFNTEAALVGDMNGNVRTERRPPQLTPPAWENRLRFAYIEAEQGRVNAYQTYSDQQSGLSVRAAFLDHLNHWTVSE